MFVPPSAEVRDLLALQLVSGVGPRLTAALLEHFGTAAAVLRADAAALRAVPGIGPKLAANLAQARDGKALATELKLVERWHVRLVPLGSPDYPPALATIPDPPYLLYLRGTLTAADANAVALVGSRHCSAYGRRVAVRLAAGLVRAGVTVVSGLPKGTGLHSTRSSRRWMQPPARTDFTRVLP